MSGLVEKSQTAILVDLVSKVALRLSLALLAISLAGLGNRLEIQLDGDGQGEVAAEPQQACGEQRTREAGEAEEKRFHLGPPIRRLLSIAHRGAA